MGAVNNGTSFMEKQALRNVPPAGSVLCIDNQFQCIKCKQPFTRVWQQVLPQPAIILSGQARVPTKLLLVFCFKCNWSYTGEEGRAWMKEHEPANTGDAPSEKTGE